MVFVSDTHRMANCWLRPGNSHTTLDSTLGQLGGKRVALLRADSDFSDLVSAIPSPSALPVTLTMD